MVLPINELNQRSLDIFRELVDTYFETGEPVGSRTLSRRLTTSLSPATIRNIMADLEEAGLLYAPHTSSGRLPTEKGLNFFVHGLLEVGDLSSEERKIIESQCQESGHNLNILLEKASSMLSGLSHCAGLVFAPTNHTKKLSKVDLVMIGGQKALLIMIFDDRTVENRIVNLPSDMPPDSLYDLMSYMNTYFTGKTLEDAKNLLSNELNSHKQELQKIADTIVKEGLAVWAGGQQEGSLIIKGQSQLLSNVTEITQLDHIRDLFTILDKKENMLNLLESSIQGEGVQIFIGSENPLFSLSGCSLVVSPYRSEGQKIIGAIGVIGPSRMNYAKIIPLVDYTAKIIARLMS